MKLKRLEIVLIAMTLAFACFTGGYFTGRKSSVNIVTIQPPEISEGIDNELRNTGVQDADTPEITVGADAPEIANEPESDLTELTAEVSGADIDVGESAGGTDKPEDTDTTEEATESPGALKEGDYRKININTASRAELTDLPGIGDVLAGRIIEYRNKNGGFSSISEIKKVSGIGDKKYEAVRDLITIG